MMRIGEDRIGVGGIVRGGRPQAPPATPREGHCPVDGERGVFRLTALVCPRCGRLLGGC